MKIIFSLIKGYLLWGFLMFFSMPSIAQNVNVNSYAFSREPLIDGIIDDVWDVNTFLEISHLLTPEAVSKENFSGKFKIGWYNNALYFLFVVTDDILALHKDYPIWLGDNINLYLDLGNEKNTSYDDNDYLCHFKWGNSDYYEIYNGVTGPIQIDNSNAGIEFAQICDTIDHTFIMEIAVRNIAELNGPSTLSDSTTIGLDAGIYDADDTGEFPQIFTTHLSWIDTTGLAWEDPSKLGTTGLGTINLKSTQLSNGMENSAQVRAAKIYPTVVSNSVIIQTTLNENLNVEVINLLGERVVSIVLTSENARIDVSSLRSGLYFVNVYYSKGFLLGKQKIMKSMY
jgi:hypothetical protein